VSPSTTSRTSNSEFASETPTRMSIHARSFRCGRPPHPLRRPRRRPHRLLPLLLPHQTLRPARRLRCRCRSLRRRRRLCRSSRLSCPPLTLLPERFLPPRACSSPSHATPRRSLSMPWPRRGCRRSAGTSRGSSSTRLFAHRVSGPPEGPRWARVAVQVPHPRLRQISRGTWSGAMHPRSRTLPRTARATTQPRHHTRPWRRSRRAVPAVLHVEASWW